MVFSRSTKPIQILLTLHLVLEIELKKDVYVNNDIKSVTGDKVSLFLRVAVMAVCGDKSFLFGRFMSNSIVKIKEDETVFL